MIGAIIGGASDEDAARMYEYGMMLGIAFQIQDDWLDVFGDSNTFGKPKSERDFSAVRKLPVKRHHGFVGFRTHSREKHPADSGGKGTLHDSALFAGKCIHIQVCMRVCHLLRPVSLSRSLR